MSSRPGLQFEEVRRVAIEWATVWAHREPGRGDLPVGSSEDRMAVDDVPVAASLRIEVFRLVLPIALAAAGLQADHGASLLAGWSKQRGLDRALRAETLRVLARGSGAPLPSATVVAISEMATPSALEPAMAVATELGDRLVVGAADPRAFRAWRRQHAPVVAALLPLGDERRILGRLAPVYAERWAAYLDAPYRFVIDGRDVTGSCLTALEPLVRRSAPWLHVERAALRRLIGGVHPECLLLASDQHRIGRLAVQVGREAGARSVVLQHGLPQYELGYVPVAADQVAVWSEASRAWFVERGTASTRLAVLGNPRLDTLARLDRAAATADVERATRLSGGPRLLVVLSPTADERNVALVDLALGWAAANRGRVIIKLHPGEGRWTAIRERVARRPDVAIAHREQLTPLLGWANVTLLHRSSVAVESLAAGTPVVVARLDAPSIAEIELPQLELPMAGDVAELTALVAELSEPVGQSGYLAQRHARLEQVSGPLDGGVSARIAAFLLAPSETRQVA